MPAAEPLLLDFATAEMAVNKARVAWAQGKKVKHGALLDADGRPTDDPGVLWASPRGSIATFGQHKGSGLALVCELLSSALGGGPMVSDGEEAGAILNNMLAIVIDPARMASGSRVAAGGRRRPRRFHQECCTGAGRGRGAGAGRAGVPRTRGFRRAHRDRRDDMGADRCRGR